MRDSFVGRGLLWGLLWVLPFATSAVDLVSQEAAPALGAAFVVEGASCPGAGASGFAASGTFLFCEGGVWRRNLYGVGVSQAWRAVGRVAGVTYSNTTGEPIITAPRASVGGAGSYCVLTVYVNGNVVYYGNSGGGYYSQSIQPHVVVPPGGTFSAWPSQCWISGWDELAP